MKTTHWIGPAAIAALFSLAGCGAITSTTDTVGRTLEVATDAVTQGTASTTDATSGGKEAPDYADARRFVHSQIVQVRREAAAGEGEHLAALANLMHEPDADAFGHWMQAHYQPLFSNLETPEALVSRIAARRG